MGDTCVCCGGPVPEGGMVCLQCAREVDEAMKVRAESADSEQWKTGGECRKCRRRNYCKTRCRKNAIRVRMMVHELLRKKYHMPSPGEDAE